MNLPLALRTGEVEAQVGCPSSPPPLSSQSDHRGLNLLDYPRCIRVVSSPPLEHHTQLRH